jgi:hypothetical protein
VTTDPQPDGGPDLIVEVTPTPTADERDALLAAFAVLVTEAARIAAPADDRPSRWARTGREEALRARDLPRRPSRASMRRRRVEVV